MVSFTSLPLYPLGKSPWYASERRLVDTRVGLDTVEKRKILHCREVYPGHPYPDE
jgi:hypothetical protein